MQMRRVQSQLALAEKRGMLAGEAVATSLFADERAVVRKAAKYWAAEVVRLRACLLELLADLPGDGAREPKNGRRTSTG
jgi:hypothetical protein